MLSTPVRRWFATGLLLLAACGAIVFNLQAARLPPERHEGGSTASFAAGSWSPRSDQVPGPGVPGVTGTGVVGTIISIACDDQDLRGGLRISTGGATQPAAVAESGIDWAIVALPTTKAGKATPPATILCQVLSDGSLRVGDAAGSLIFIRN